MEDIPDSPGVPAAVPEGQPDPDADRPVDELEGDDEADAAPIGEPGQDMDTVEKLPDGRDINEEADEDAFENKSDSDLSELDEEQFKEFDPSAINIEEPTQVDSANLGLIGKHKRKKTEGGEEGKEKKKKRREARKRRRAADDDEVPDTTEHIEGKRPRKRAVRDATPEVDEDTLTPEERRRRALERALDEGLKGDKKRRTKKGEVDLEAQQDELIEDMRQRMTTAAKIDNEKREAGQPATEKLRLLPEVTSLLNRNNLWRSICDPDTNLLEAVKFFLEPLNDASMPAFNIQKSLFSALTVLPMTKDSLISSGLGKLVLFYSKSKWVEPSIKRHAERLLGEWTRLVTNRTDDYRKREVETASYDPSMLLAQRNEDNRAQITADARARKLAVPAIRARMEGGPLSYTVAPRNNISVAQRAKVYGKLGDAAFNRLKNKSAGGRGGGH